MTAVSARGARVETAGAVVETRAGVTGRRVDDLTHPASPPARTHTREAASRPRHTGAAVTTGGVAARAGG